MEPRTPGAALVPGVLAFEDAERAGDGGALGCPRSCGFGDVERTGLGVGSEG